MAIVERLRRRLMAILDTVFGEDKRIRVDAPANTEIELRIRACGAAPPVEAENDQSSE